MTTAIGPSADEGVDRPSGGPDPYRPAGFPAALLALLAAEAAVAAERYWWLALGEDFRFRDVLALGLTFAVAVAVFAGDRVRRAAGVFAAHRRAAFPWGLVVAQVAVFAAFVLFSRPAVSGRLGWTPAGGPWLATWAVTGLTALVLGALALLPARGWRELARRGWKDAALAGTVVLAAWAASRWTQHLWTGLADDTLAGVEFVLRRFYTAVEVVPGDRVIGAAGFVVEVGPPCSGYEGFGLVTAVVGCYLWLCRDALRFPAALFLLPLALAASWVLNVLRIAALIAVGAEGWPGVAVDGFHTQAGWIAFNAVALGVIALSRAVPVFRRAPPAGTAAPARGPNPAAPLLVPMLVIAAAAMLTAAASAGGPDRLYPVRAAALGLTLWAYRRHYRGLGWGWSWAAAGVGLAVFGLWIGLDQIIPSGDEPAAGPAGLPPVERGVWLACRLVGAVVLVPVAEELAFRAYLLRRLQGAELGDDMKGRWDGFAVVVSSVLFGLLHPGRWAAGTLAGVLFAAAFYRRGRLSDAILAHAVANAALAGYVLLTGQWQYW